MRKIRILIVDHTDAFRENLKKSLQVCFPMTVIDGAANGREALVKVDSLLPDLIFMDINLLGVNALELTKEIKATHPNIAIIILTPYDTPAYREAASQYGADRFVCKGNLHSMEVQVVVRSNQKL